MAAYIHTASNLQMEYLSLTDRLFGISSWNELVVAVFIPFTWTKRAQNTFIVTVNWAAKQSNGAHSFWLLLLETELFLFSIIILSN